MGRVSYAVVPQQQSSKILGFCYNKNHGEQKISTAVLLDRRSLLLCCFAAKNRSSGAVRRESRRFLLLPLLLFAATNMEKTQGKH